MGVQKIWRYIKWCIKIKSIDEYLYEDILIKAKNMLFLYCIPKSTLRGGKKIIGASATKRLENSRIFRYGFFDKGQKIRVGKNPFFLKSPWFGFFGVIFGFLGFFEYGFFCFFLFHNLNLKAKVTLFLIKSSMTNKKTFNSKS